MMKEYLGDVTPRLYLPMPTETGLEIGSTEKETSEAEVAPGDIGSLQRLVKIQDLPFDGAVADQEVPMFRSRGAGGKLHGADHRSGDGVVYPFHAMTFADTATARGGGIIIITTPDPHATDQGNAAVATAANAATAISPPHHLADESLAHHLASKNHTNATIPLSAPCPLLLPHQHHHHL
ncbi:MAG: hypothetical protein LQ341_007842 [Variospora aurantia]|nr:MAG: hypothetical protein LQ341_007842 [Variospora aurantia]